MEPENIAKIIKDIRLKNNLSQKEFAEKFGVTFQAVSKWENGKNIPDISILKAICQEYNISLDGLIINNKQNNHKKIILIVIIIFLVIITIFFLFFHHHDFEFKTISANCSDFKVTGSIAYNKDKTSIYISNINYCGTSVLENYDTINCNLYEDNGKTKNIIESCNKLENINLKDYLENITFHIDNYIQTCKKYTENSLYLEIEANKSGNIIEYKIPLKLTSNCD